VANLVYAMRTFFRRNPCAMAYARVPQDPLARHAALGPRARWGRGMPSGPVRGGAQDGDDRPPLPGACSDRPALARRPPAANNHTPSIRYGALYTVPCITLSRGTL
jgi:hypothetical protein